MQVAPLGERLYLLMESYFSSVAGCRRAVCDSNVGAFPLGLTSCSMTGLTAGLAAGVAACFMACLMARLLLFGEDTILCSSSAVSLC